VGQNLNYFKKLITYLYDDAERYCIYKIYSAVYTKYMKTALGISGQGEISTKFNHF